MPLVNRLPIRRHINTLETALRKISGVIHYLPQTPITRRAAIEQSFHESQRGTWVGIVPHLVMHALEKLIL
jgi:hypothetical protein